MCDIYTAGDYFPLKQESFATCFMNEVQEYYGK